MGKILVVRPEVRNEHDRSIMTKVRKRITRMERIIWVTGIVNNLSESMDLLIADIRLGTFYSYFSEHYCLQSI